MCRILRHPRLDNALRRLSACADPASPWVLAALLERARLLRRRTAELSPDIEPPVEVRVLGAAAGAAREVRRNMPVTATLVLVGWLLSVIMQAWLSGAFHLSRGIHFIMPM